MIYEKLGDYLRRAYTDKLFTSRLSRHEAIRAQLYMLGFKEHLFPILEAQSKLGRVDCIFLQGDKPVCAIEIDYSIRKKSIEKLNALPRDTEKILISYCSAKPPYWRALSRHKDKLGDIRVFRYKDNDWY